MPAPGAPLPSVLVTGASTGIGRATALLLDERGLAVFAGVRRQEDGESLARDAGDRLVPVLLDVREAASIEAVVKQVSAAVGGRGLAGLVNNAGIAVGGVLEFLDLDELRRQLEVNVVGPVAITRAFLPLLRMGRGRIVNVSSNGGYVAAPFVGPYAASKFALEALSDSLRRELRPWGLQVSVIEPGSIETPIWDKGREEARSIREALSDEARELYRPALDRMDAYIDKTSRRGIPPAVVAKAIHHALTAARPRTRYPVGLDAKLMRVLSLVLPDRALDAFIARMVGYGNL